MHSVVPRNGEDIDRTLKRLKNKMDVDSIIEIVRTKRAFETPSQKYKRKQKALDKSIKFAKR